MTHQPDLTDPSIARALSNPRRHTLLAELVDSATISQLSVRLSMNKGSVSHHLRVLLEAGLVRQVSTRTVRGGTEIYFERTLARWILPNRSAASTAATAAIIDAINADPAAHVHHRTLRLTRNQARDVARQLDRFLESLEPAGVGTTRHAVMVAVYAPGPQRRRPRPVVPDF